MGLGRAKLVVNDLNKKKEKTLLYKRPRWKDKGGKKGGAV